LAVSSSRNLTAALAGLRDEIGAISSLLEHAASYHANLLQSMIAASASEAPQDGRHEPVRRMSLVA
jgi:hypothetical protein